MSTDTTETPLPPEPDDGTALYWPETAKKAGGILIRDDWTAGMLEDPEHHWFSPGSDEWTNWPDIVTALTADGFDLSDAVALRPVAEVERLTADLRTLATETRMAAYRAARGWAAQHDHPQPDDRMIKAVLAAVLTPLADAIEAADPSGWSDKAADLVRRLAPAAPEPGAAPAGLHPHQ